MGPRSLCTARTVRRLDAATTVNSVELAGSLCVRVVEGLELAKFRGWKSVKRATRESDLGYRSQSAPQPAISGPLHQVPLKSAGHDVEPDISICRRCIQLQCQH